MHSFGLPFLKSGFTRAVFKQSGKVEVKMGRLVRSAITGISQYLFSFSALILCLQLNIMPTTDMSKLWQKSICVYRCQPRVCHIKTCRYVVWSDSICCHSFMLRRRSFSQLSSIFVWYKGIVMWGVLQVGISEINKPEHQTKNNGWINTSLDMVRKCLLGKTSQVLICTPAFFGADNCTST